MDEDGARAANGTPAHGGGGGVISGMTPGHAGLQTPASSQLGIELGTGSSSMPGAGGSAKQKGCVSVQPSQRWVIYYDKNGNELQRKQKGPGRLPRGAYLEGDNYIVKDCVVNKNTQEVMTVPTYVPTEQRKEKYRSETEQYLGFDFLPANTMVAPIGVGAAAAAAAMALAARPPPRAARMKTSMVEGALEDDNPYAKFRYNTRPSDKGPDPDMQQQTGSAAYTKRHKSPWQFPAPVPPEDREAYEKGYSLLPGGGRGQYLAPKYQMPGEECFALNLQGALQLLPPHHPHKAQQPLNEAVEAAAISNVQAEVREAKANKSEGAGDVREEVEVADDSKPSRELERGREAKEGDADVAASSGAAGSAPVSGAVEEEEMMEFVEDKEASNIIALWKSLGSPGGAEDDKHKILSAAKVEKGHASTEDKADDNEKSVVGASGQVGNGGSQRGWVGEASVTPSLCLEGQLFSFVEVYRAVRTLGGSRKVHCWGLVVDAMLVARGDVASPASAAASTPAAAAAALARKLAASTSAYASVAQRVREFVSTTRLDLIESHLVTGLPAGTGSGEGVGDVDMAESDGGGGGVKMVVMLPQGKWLSYGEELVLGSDGFLHHAQVVRQSGGEQWRASHEMLQAYAAADRTWEAQKTWWSNYQKFAATVGLPADSPNVSVALESGGIPKSLPLFTLYHSVRQRGGLHAVIVKVEILNSAFYSIYY